MRLLDTQLIPYLYQLMKAVEKVVEEVKKEVVIEVLLAKIDTEDEVISDDPQDHAWQTMVSRMLSVTRGEIMVEVQIIIPS